MVYKWKTPYFKSDPNEAGRICEELEQTVGLSAETLVDASRPEDAPLHDEFEWDDEIAAEKYRYSQARILISNLIIMEPKTQTSTRGFVTITASKKKSNEYVNIAEVLSDEVKRKKLYRIAKRELESFRLKYANLKEFDKVFRAIDQLEDE